MTPGDRPCGQRAVSEEAWASQVSCKMKTFNKVCKSIRRVRCQSGVKLLKEGLLSLRKAGGGRCQSPLATFQFIYSTYCSNNIGRPTEKPDPSV